MSLVEKWSRVLNKVKEIKPEYHQPFAQLCENQMNEVDIADFILFPFPFIRKVFADLCNEGIKINVLESDAGTVVEDLMEIDLQQIKDLIRSCVMGIDATSLISDVVAVKAVKAIKEKYSNKIFNIYLLTVSDEISDIFCPAKITMRGIFKSKDRNNRRLSE